MKKIVTLVSLFAFTVTFLVAISVAADNGSAEIVLKSTVDPAKKTKLAFFPHKKHQANFDCSTCHHSKSDDGKQIAYTDGQKIEKCESCHNSKSGINKDLATFKKAAHARCKKCHKELKKAGKETGPTKCKGCHKKDLK